MLRVIEKRVKMTEWEIGVLHVERFMCVLENQTEEIKTMKEAAVEGGDESWNPKILDDLSKNNENVPTDSQRKEDQNGYSHHQSSTWEHDTSVSLSSSVHGVNESVDHGVSTNPFLVDDYDNMYTSTNVLDCDVTVSEVSYAEDNIVKDICIDMGVPEKEKAVTDAVPINHESFNPFHGSDEDKEHCDPMIGCNNTEVIFTSDEITNIIGSNGCESKEANYVKTVDPETLKFPFDDSFEKKSHELYDSGDLKSNTTVSDSLEIDPPVDTELSTQRSLGSFLSREVEETQKTTQLHDQIDIEQVTESFKTSLACPDEDVEENNSSSNMLYNRKVETESITFNFDSDPSPEKADRTTNEAIETLKRDTEDVRGDDDNLKDDPEKDTNYNKNAHGAQPLVTTEDIAKSDNLSEANQAGPGEKVLVEQSSRKSTSEDLSHQEDLVQSTARKIRTPFQYDEGETSFSAGSLAGFSGPVPYSGSISHRSDASTTSGRSFAFPVLQSEWNSSPVRMAKADRTHFRKHKGWRSGLLCCRF